MSAGSLVFIAYQFNVSKCIKIANNILAIRTGIDTKLLEHNENISSIKATALDISWKHQNLFIANEIFELEQSTQKLNDAVEAHYQYALGRLGCSLDELRSANEELERLMPDELESMMPALAACRRDLDQVCEKLVACSIIDPATLRAMGIMA
ncbi:hypothetical protein OKW98_23315 [Pseudomonas sp. KU26590]|uniref:hypothetical protein n=1 Tax=Pseudomonas sp. KU26590 TaxID=2991051 RepID=UPI00223DED5A|nr:hypothetical protein [Pseudomonas sp. KU26590]UZJ59447.1 hypothetical protein OKW98_23315 [Pseudomonas sp. KU26590]